MTTTMRMRLGSTTRSLAVSACPPRACSARPCGYGAARARLSAPASTAAEGKARLVLGRRGVANLGGTRADRRMRVGSRPTLCHSSKPDIGDRCISGLVYLLPLLDGLRYSRFFFRDYPSLAKILIPLEPLIQTYYTLPFASIIVFFGLYYGVVNNYNLNRYTRYNAMQAILLDLLLIIPNLLESLLFRGPKVGIYVTFSNTIWLYVFASVIYGVSSCLAGEKPRIPGVADAADRQVPM